MCKASEEVVTQIIGEENIKPQDQLNTMAYFITPIYTIKKKEFLVDAQTVFYETLAPLKKEKKKTVDKLVAELYPSIMTGNLFNEPRLQLLCSYIASTAWNILQAQGYLMENKLTFFTEFWGQEHYKHSAMEEHVHPYGAQIVGFYFIDVPPNSSKVVIHDPRPGKVMSHMAETNTANVTEASNMINFTPEPGMIFFAPSWLPHSFTRHGSQKPLKFIHFNIGVRVNENLPVAMPSSDAEII